MGRRVVGGSTVPNLRGEPIRKTTAVLNFNLWRETQKESLSEPVQDKKQHAFMKSDKNAISFYKLIITGLI